MKTEISFTPKSLEQLIDVLYEMTMRDVNNIKAAFFNEGDFRLMPWMRPKFLKARDFLQNNPDIFQSLFEDFLNDEIDEEDYMVTGAGIELPLNANMIKTKQGSRSRGRESRTRTIRKKVTGILKKKKKQNFEDEDWI